MIDAASTRLKVGPPVKVEDRPLEFSGCAVVDGGILVVEDELVGSVLLVEEAGTAPRVKKSIKLERRKKERAPFTSAHKLFPVQDFEDIASDREEAVYLLGSHEGKGGDRRPAREFLLYAKWDRKEEELKVRAERYDLLPGIADALGTLGVPVGLSPTGIETDINLEGLAFHDKRLYLGVRAPLTPGSKAIVLSASVGSLFESSGNVIWDIHTIELDGGGVRAMDWDPAREALLMLSGPAGDSDATVAALWHWKASDAAVKRLVAFDPAIARKGPEGVCRLPDSDGGRIMVVLDGGDAAGAEILHLSEP